MKQAGRPRVSCLDKSLVQWDRGEGEGECCRQQIGKGVWRWAGREVGVGVLFCAPYTCKRVMSLPVLPLSFHSRMPLYGTPLKGRGGGARYGAARQGSRLRHVYMGRAVRQHLYGKSRGAWRRCGVGHKGRCRCGGHCWPSNGTGTVAAVRPPNSLRGLGPGGGAGGLGHVLGLPCGV